MSSSKRLLPKRARDRDLCGATAPGAAKAQLETFQHDERGMAEHLTRDDMVVVSRQAARAPRSRLSGFAVVAHGLYRRREAQRAIGEVPEARVVKR